MHVTFIALGSLGDILPCLTLSGSLRRSGHEVRFITFENFSSLAEEQDLDFYPIRGDARALVNQAGANMLALARTFASLGNSYAQDLSDPKLLETDLFINQLPVGLFGFDLAEKAGVTMFQASVMPLTRTGYFPLVGSPGIPLPGYNKLTYFVAEQMAWQMMRRAVNRWRRETLGLPAHPMFGYFDQLAAERRPVLNAFSPSVVPIPPDWGKYVQVTGYWFSKDELWQPPAELVEFIDMGSPPVFFGFGSMPLKDPKRLLENILKALEDSDQRGIIHSGWAGLGQPELPDNVYLLAYAPYEWLFPKMAAIVHHGGSGTTAHGLRAGKPSLILPSVFDQHYWGKRIASLGVGPEPIPIRRFMSRQSGSAQLQSAIEQATQDGEMQQRAADLGRKIKGEDGLGRAIEIIEQQVTIA